MEGNLPNDSSDLRTDLISSFPVTLLLMFGHARLVTVTFLPEQKLKLRIESITSRYRSPLDERTFQLAPTALRRWKKETLKGEGEEKPAL